MEERIPMQSGEQIVVIADDFSGGAEIAGIGHRYGLSTVMVSTLHFPQKFDLLVINSNSRTLKVEDAEERVRQIAKKIKATDEDFVLFKKIDSVLRGHVLAEARQLLDYLEFERAILMSANPTKGRIIREGKYFVQGILLEKTAFRDDPGFPRQCSYLPDLLQPVPAGLVYRHLEREEKPPKKGVFSRDIQSTSELMSQLSDLAPTDFCCGGADAFEAYLKVVRKVKAENFTPPSPTGSEYRLIINGSTMRQVDEIERLIRKGVSCLNLPHDLGSSPRALNSLSKNISNEVLDNNTVYLQVGPLSVSDKDLRSKIEYCFGSVVRQVLNTLMEKPFHLYLTGGSTAAAVVANLGYDQFEVVREQAPGVVTLSPPGTNLRITVKPGSYDWPSPLFEETGQRPR